jgi:hypothetical protein
MSHKIFKEESTMLTKKKLASLAMAGVMTLSLASSAFAAESTTNRSLKVTAAYQAVTIAVVVPTTGTVVIDPYGLPVSIGTDADGNELKVSSKQIVSKPMAVKNQGDIDLTMNIATTTALTGSLKLTTAAVADDGTGTANSAYVWVSVQKSTLTGDKDALSDAAIAKDYYDYSWPDYATDNDGKTQIILKSGGQTLKGIALTAAKYDDNAFSEYQDGSVYYIHFDGDCTIEPKTAWTTKDGLTCTMAFTFTPDTSSSSGNGADGT